MFLFPLLLSEFTRTGLTSENVYFVSVGICVALLASLAFQWVLRRHGEYLAAAYSLHLRLKYFRALEAQPFEKLTSFHSQYTASMIGSVSDGVAGLTNEMFWSIGRGIAIFCLFFIFTARESTTIAAVNAVLLVIFVIASTKLSARIAPIAHDLNAARASLASRFGDFLANTVTIRKLGVGSYALDRLTQSTRATERELVRLHRFHAWRWFALHTLWATALLSTVVFLLHRIAIGTGSPAPLILFVAAFSTLRTLVERLSEDIKSMIELQTYITSLHAIVDIADPPLPEAQHEPMEEIRLVDVAFQHRGNEAMILVPELTIRPGEWHGVGGESGQGKSTILNLVAGLIEPQSGQRFFNGREYTREIVATLSREISFVSQEVELFHLSLRENLTLETRFPDEELLALLDELGLADWVRGLEHGLDTLVGEKGIRLSSGQRQRIHLLRALILNRPLLFLDEPTAHLDRATERRVLEFLERRFSNTTALIVSHRPAIMELCGKRWNVRDHRLCEADTTFSAG